MSVVKYHAQITYLAVTVKGYTVEVVQMKGGMMMAKYESEILHQLHPKGYLYWAESHEEKLKREESEYGREGCVELSSHCAQSLHMCHKGNAQTSYGW